VERGGCRENRGNDLRNILALVVRGQHHARPVFVHGGELSSKARTSSATRRAAPADPRGASSARTSFSAPSCAARSGVLESSGSSAETIRSGVHSSCSSSGTAARPQMRLTREMNFTRTSKRPLHHVSELVL